MQSYPPKTGECAAPSNNGFGCQLRMSTRSETEKVGRSWFSIENRGKQRDTLNFQIGQFAWMWGLIWTLCLIDWSKSFEFVVRRSPIYLTDASKTMRGTGASLYSPASLFVSHRIWVRLYLSLLRRRERSLTDPFLGNTMSMKLFIKCDERECVFMWDFRLIDTCI